MNGRRQLRTDAQAPRGIGARIAGFAYIALLPPAAFAVHQLRYWLAYGSRAGIELQRTGHSYLHSVVPWLVAAVGTDDRCVLAGAGPGVRRAHVAGSLHAVADGNVACVLGGARRDLRLPGVPRGSVRDRAPSRTGGDLRLRRLVVDPGRAVHRLGARDGAARRSVARAQGRPPASATLSALLSGQRCVRRVPAMRWSCVRRRWSVAGRVGVRRRSSETRCSLACEPAAEFCLL